MRSLEGFKVWLIPILVNSKNLGSFKIIDYERLMNLIRSLIQFSKYP